MTYKLIPKNIINYYFQIKLTNMCLTLTKKDLF